MVELDRGKLVFDVWRYWLGNVLAMCIQAETDMLVILKFSIEKA
jgi:hypothetical protein